LRYLTINQHYFQGSDFFVRYEINTLEFQALAIEILDH